MSQQKAGARYQRRQLAIRRLLLDGRGGLNADARILVADFRRFCHADRELLKYSPVSGMVDPIATAAAAARREVFDRYFRLLMIDAQAVYTAKDDE